MKRNFWILAIAHVVTFAAAPFLFTPGALVFALVTAVAFNVAAHVFHHHGVARGEYAPASRSVEIAGNLLGTLSWRGPHSSPVRYAAMYRVHRRHAGTDLDPFTRRRWILPLGFSRPEHYHGYVEDVVDDPFLRYLDANVDRVQLAWAIALFVVGLAGGGWMGALRLVIYGVAVRTVIAVALDALRLMLGGKRAPGYSRSAAA